MRKKQKNKKDFFKKNYIQSWKYIKESKHFIYFIIILFLFFSLLGFFVPAPENISAYILEFIEELLRKTEGMSWGELMRFIFLNNIQGSFFGMIFGILLGVFPLMSVIANGYLLGFVAAKSVQSEGILILWRLFPHGIFEISALFISLGMGLRLGTFIFQKKKLKSLQRYIWESLRVFLFVVIPLLIIAAIIEGSFIFLFP
jgi:stage II sporulation protein M